MKSDQNLQELPLLGLPNVLPEKSYDQLTYLAAYICNTPISLITFLGSDYQYFKSHFGVEIDKTPIQYSFCAHAVGEPSEVMIVNDARQDELFKDNPLTTEDPHFIFYAGVPIYLPDETPVGTLCVIDKKPRRLSKQQIEALQALATQAEQLLEMYTKDIQLRESQKMLQKESNRLLNIIEATQVGTWEWNIQTGEVVINARWAEMIGYNKEELQPLNIETWYRVVHPEDRDKSDAQLQACMDGEAAFYDIECRLLHKDGHVVWINDRGKVIKRTADGKALRMAGTHTDITERKNNEEQFATITNNIPGVVFRYKLYPDGTDRLMKVSEGARHLWGVSVQDAMRDNQLIWERYDDQDLRAHLQSMHKSAQDFSRWEHEWRYRHPDGTLHWHKGSGNLTQEEDGSVTWDSLILDVTDRKRAEQERVKAEKLLIERNEEFQRGLDNSLDIICTVNAEGIFTSVSPASFSVLGYQPDEMTGKHIFDFITEEDKPKTIVAGEEVVDRIKLRSFENQYVHKEGHLIPIIWNLYWDQEHQTLHCVGRDDSERQKALSEISLLINNTEEAFILMGRDLRITIFNDQFGKLYESYFGRQVQKGEYILDYAQPERREALKGIYQQVLNGEKHSSELTVPLEHEADRVVAISYNPAKDKYGNVFGAFVAITDITERKQAEHKLMVSEKRFRTLVENSGDAVAILTPDGHPSFVSSSISNVLGYSESEAMKIDLMSLMHPTDLPLVHKVLEQAMKEPGVPQPPSVARARHKDGSWRWMEAVITNMLHDPAVNGIVDNFRDVTHQKNEQLKHELLNEVSQFFMIDEELKPTLRQVLYHLVSIGDFDLAEVWLTNRDQTKINLATYYPQNQTAKAFYKKGSHTSFDFGEGLPGKAWKSKKPIVYDNLAEHPSFARKNEASSAGLEAAMAIPLVHNKQVVGVLLCAIRGKADQLKSYMDLVYGISDYLGAEINRKQLQDEMQLLFESAPDILAITSPTGYFVKVNPAFCKLLGYSEEELTSKPYDHFIHREDRGNGQEDFAITGDRQADNYINRLKTKDGGYCWISWNSSKVFSDEGLVFSYGRDITAVKKLQNLLDNASQLAQLGGWEVDLRTETVFWSDITKQIHEVPDDYEPDVDSALHFYREDAEQTIRKHFEQALKSGTGWDLELPIITANGHERWVRTIGKTEFENGKCARVLGSFQDIHARKTAELDMIKFKQVIENSQDAIAMAGPDLKTLYMNPTMQHTFGTNEYALDKVGGSPSVYADTQLADEVFSTLLTGQYWKGDVQLISRKGERIDFYLSAGPVLNDQDELIAIYGIHTDITERKQAEKALEEAFDEKHQILESIGDAFFSLTHDFKVTYWNRMAEKLLQTPRENIVGKNLWEVFADAVVLPSYINYHKAIREKKVIHFEDYYEPIQSWFEISTYPSEKGLTVYFKDITERKKAIEEIRLAKERFEKASEATNDAIWDWDIVNDTLYWGRGFQKLFGHDLKQIDSTLKAWEEHVHPEDIGPVMSSLDALFQNQGENHWQFEYRYKKNTGEYLYALDKGIVTRDADGRAIRMVGAMSDITHHKEYEKSLKELNNQLEERARLLAISNDELEQFAYVASHDLQEPLRMVTSFLTQLDKKYKDQLDEKAHQYIDFAVDGAKRMRRIILDLLEFSRVGRHDDNLANLPLNAVVNEVSSLLHREIEKSGAQIHFNDLPVVTSYKSPLVHIFQNLISNAIKYTDVKKSPDITITAKRKKKEWLIEVKDNGIGIEEEYFDKIFVIFQRLHGREEFSGTGMGLALVKKNVEALGGRVWLESRPGRGSTFFFTLPEMS